MKKNSDIFSEVVVGVFMVAVLALLVYFTVVISGVDVLFGREKALARIAFTDVGGLKERDNVVYRGMKVGIVEKIELAPTNVMVTVLVDRDVVLRETCDVTPQYRANWKQDRKRRKKLQPKEGFLNTTWQTISNQRWDELTQSWIITTLQAPAGIITQDVIDKLGLEPEAAPGR